MKREISARPRQRSSTSVHRDREGIGGGSGIHLFFDSLCGRVPLLGIGQCRLIVDWEIVGHATLTFWQCFGEVAENGAR